MNTTKKTRQSRPASVGDNPLVEPVDHGEKMLTPVDTDDLEIGKHDSLTELAEETVFEEESLYSPDSLQDYDMLLKPEDENSMAIEKDSWFADTIFAADNGSVTDDDYVAEDEELASFDLPVKPTFYDLTKEGEVDLDIEESDDDIQLSDEQLHVFEGDDSTTEDTKVDNFEGLLGDDSGRQSVLDYELEADLLESDQTAEDETQENLEAEEQESPDDDSIIFTDQLHGFEGDNSAAENPTFDIFTALPGTASDELEDVLDEFFTREDNTSSDLDKFADLLDDDGSGESGFTAEPTGDIFEPELTTEDEATEDYEETETENAVFADPAVDQTVIIPNMNEEVLPYKVTEQIVTDQFPKEMMPEREVVLSPVAPIAQAGAPSKQNIRELIDGRLHCLVNQGKRLVIVPVVLVMLGGAWYSYNNRGDGSHTLQQQVSRNKLDDHSEVEVTALNQPEPKMPKSSDSGKDSVNEPKQKISEQLENNSGELDRRLSEEEQKLRRYGNSDQPAQVNNKLKLPAQMQSIETDQAGVTKKITLQPGQLETDIGQPENQGSQLQQEQNTVRNTISSAEQKTVANTAAPAAIEIETGLKQEQKKQPAIVSESITAKVVSGPAEQRTSATPPQNITEVKETISFRPDKPILPEAGAAKQTGWAVNLSSFRKRTMAEKERKRLNGLGLGAVTSKALVHGTFWFRVQIEGFASSRDAWEYIKLNLDHNKFKDAWVSKKPQ